MQEGVIIQIFLPAIALITYTYFSLDFPKRQKREVQKQKETQEKLEQKEEKAEKKRHGNMKREYSWIKSLKKGK